MAFKNKNIVRQGPFFTHFATLPFIEPQHRTSMKQIQTEIRKMIHTHPKYQQPDVIRQHPYDQCHLTLFKLVLRHQKTKQQMIAFMNEHSELIKKSLQEVVVKVENVNYFTRFNKNQKCRQIIVIYGEVDQKSRAVINKLTDVLMRALLKEQIIVASELKDMNVIYDHNNNLYKPQTLHVSLFRARNLLEDELFKNIFKNIQQQYQPFTAQCSFMDISTMCKEYDNDNYYLPLHRIVLKEEDKEEKEQKEQKKQVGQAKKEEVINDDQ